MIHIVGKVGINRTTTTIEQHTLSINFNNTLYQHNLSTPPDLPPPISTPSVKAMLIRLYASNNDAVAAVDLVNAESDATVTPHMLASAISACTGGTGGSGGGDSSHGHTSRDGSKIGASTSTSTTESGTGSRYNNRLSSTASSSSSSSSSSSTMSWKDALVLLQRGIRLSKADEAVFTAAAQCCARQGQYTYAFRIMGDTRDYHTP